MEEVYSFLSKRLKQNDIIVAGISGGPDSMALLYILEEFKEKLNLKIICAHINHNKRKESEQERKDLENYCNKNNLLFKYIKINDWGDDNFHNEARTVRYNYFEELIEKYGAKYLMTAHHGDDLIETIMMRIVRGSTLKGYSGFSRIVDKGNYSILRPLITVTKDEILKFVKFHNLSYATDQSNFSDVYTRNRYRKNILPFLKKEDDSVHKKFLKFSEILLENSEYIDNEANKVFNKVFQEGLLDIEKFRSLNKVIQTKIVYNILEKIYGDDLLVITDSHVELIFNLIISSKPNAFIHLPNNIIISKSYNYLAIDYSEEYDEYYEVELEDIVTLLNNKQIKRIKESNEKSNYVTRLNSKELQLPLYVRNRKDGDKMEIKGMLGSKKISHIFIDEKINMKDRNVWPVVLDSNEKIIWVPGLKKSKFDKEIEEEYDIILKYE